MLCLVIASGYYATNYFPNEQLETILADPIDVHCRVIGSIIVLGLEQSMLMTLWTIKIYLIVFMYRVT